MVDINITKNENMGAIILPMSEIRALVKNKETVAGIAPEVLQKIEQKNAKLQDFAPVVILGDYDTKKGTITAQHAFEADGWTINGHGIATITEHYRLDTDQLKVNALAERGLLPKGSQNLEIEYVSTDKTHPHASANRGKGQGEPVSKLSNEGMQALVDFVAANEKFLAMQQSLDAVSSGMRLAVKEAEKATLATEQGGPGSSTKQQTSLNSGASIKSI